MTTIYFIRHSKAEKVNNILNSDSLQLQNEKNILSVDGEKLAKSKLDIDELKNIDVLISSNYVRAIATAKYIASNNNIGINIAESFGERKFGVNSYGELPSNFYEKQFFEDDFKIGDGESQTEVRNRMYKALMEVLVSYKNKRIAIVTHSTSLSFLLMRWCDINKEKGIYYKNRFVGHIQIENCAIFKLDFDDENCLIDINKV